MIIGPTLVIVIICNLLVSSLITSVAVNVNKTYHHDHKAEEYAIGASAVGFGSIGVLVGLLLLNKMFMKIEKVYLYSLLWIWTVLIILTTLSYLVYDKLVLSKHFPNGAKHVANNTEIKLAFAAFCFSIIGLSVGITYVITTGVNEGYLDTFKLKNIFTDSGFKKAEETIEMNDLISDLTETSF